VLASLRARSWPGNARELRNVVQAYAVLGVLPELKRDKAGLLNLALQELIDLERPYADQKDEIVDQFSRLYLKALLDHTNGNQTLAARLAGLDRTYLGRLLARVARPDKR
jgi:DNA-binding NtrC family response regulator